MKSRLNKKSRFFVLARIIAVAALAALFLFFLNFQPAFSKKLTGFGLSLAQPFFNFKNETIKWLEKKSSLFKEKEALERENAELKEKLFQSETDILFAEFLKEENQRLRSLLGRDEEKKFVLAAVLFRPPQSGYDVLIIDAGAEQGLKPGLPVTFRGEILLGHLSEVYQNQSRVRLVSSFERETGVMLENSGLSAVAVGRGGENLELKLPRSLPIFPGEGIITLSTPPLLLGFVYSIEKSAADPFQKVIFRLPLNLNQLRYVLVDAS